MRTEQRIWTSENGWNIANSHLPEAQLVLVFIGIDVENQAQLLSELKNAYPNGDIVFCSTAGEIAKDEILDNSAVAPPSISIIRPSRYIVSKSRTLMKVKIAELKSLKH